MSVRIICLSYVGVKGVRRGGWWYKTWSVQGYSKLLWANKNITMFNG